jgi:hypothetical protein
MFFVDAIKNCLFFVKMYQNKFAEVAQLVEQLTCNQ